MFFSYVMTTEPKLYALVDVKSVQELFEVLTSINEKLGNVPKNLKQKHDLYGGAITSVENDKFTEYEFEKNDEIEDLREDDDPKKFRVVRTIPLRKKDGEIVGQRKVIGVRATDGKKPQKKMNTQMSPQEMFSLTERLKMFSEKFDVTFGGTKKCFDECRNNSLENQYMIISSKTSNRSATVPVNLLSSLFLKSRKNSKTEFSKEVLDYYRPFLSKIPSDYFQNKILYDKMVLNKNTDRRIIKRRAKQNSLTGQQKRVKTC